MKRKTVIIAIAIVAAAVAVFFIVRKVNASSVEPAETKNEHGLGLLIE